MSKKTERELRESVELFVGRETRQTNNGRQDRMSGVQDTTTNGSSVPNVNGSIQPAKRKVEDVDMKPARDSAEPGEYQEHNGGS